MELYGPLSRRCNSSNIYTCCLDLKVDVHMKPGGAVGGEETTDSLPLPKPDEVEKKFLFFKIKSILFSFHAELWELCDLVTPDLTRIENLFIFIYSTSELDMYFKKCKIVLVVIFFL